MSARTYGPGFYQWALAAEFRSAVPASVSGYGVIELTEAESELSVCARLVRELGGPNLAGLDSTAAFTLRPARAGSGAEPVAAPVETTVTYTLTPGWIDVDVFGWELTSVDLADCHATFAPGADLDVEMAMSWAESLIGSRQAWRHVRERGFDRWEA